MTALDQDFIRQIKHAYFIGIGGVGMSALARVLKFRGLNVSGSDNKFTRTTQELRDEGIPVHIGQQEIHFQDADLVIYSSAIRPNHLELQTARINGMRVCHRAELLSSILNQAETSVAVTGTHGKTTTSSMISFVLSELGKNPTCLIGGDLLNKGTNALLGDMRFCVAEVDESDKTHELYTPSYAVLTNLEEDHLENYGNFSNLEASFARFMTKVKNPGVLISNADDPALERLTGASGQPKILFGYSPQADFSAGNVCHDSFGSTFDLIEVGFFAARVRINLPGRHNVMNSLAAVTLLLQLGIDLEEIVEVLPRFKGARRRLEVKWRSEDLLVIDDYAHHPTEVQACVASLKKMGDPITVIFQPHRFSRTRYFCKQFAEVLQDVDRVILTEVYSAGEERSLNDGVQMIYENLRQLNHPSVCMLDKEAIVDYLDGKNVPRGIYAFVGAGDIGDVANEFANRFKNCASAKG